MLHWTKEDTPRWDAAKQRLFGPGELAATGMVAPAPGSPIADEWWHVTGDDGEVAGYGWLDSPTCSRSDARRTSASRSAATVLSSNDGTTPRGA